MKKIGILNQPISSVIAGLGHMDTLVVADAGLPIPQGTQRIDLALAEGIPSFLDTLRAVLTEMQVEQAIVAEEMLEVSPDVHEAIGELLGDVPIEATKLGAQPCHILRSRSERARPMPSSARESLRPMPTSSWWQARCSDSERIFC